MRLLGQLLLTAACGMWATSALAQGGNWLAVSDSAPASIVRLKKPVVLDKTMPSSPNGHIQRTTFEFTPVRKSPVIRAQGGGVPPIPPPPLPGGGPPDPYTAPIATDPLAPDVPGPMNQPFIEPAPNNGMFKGIMVPDACCNACCNAPRFWVRGEFLLWWMDDQPVANPLVTTGSAADALPGALGQPNTAVLFGGQNADMDTFLGARLSGGVRIRPRLNLEGNIFFLRENSSSFAAASNAGGTPLLAVPVLDTSVNAERAFILAVPGIQSGGVEVAYDSEMWGTELNAALHLYCVNNFHFVALAGFRYIELEEALFVRATTTPIGVNTVNFGGAPIGSTVTAFDQFSTGNDLFAGQLGASAKYQLGPVYFGVTGKLALGINNQTVNVQGNTVRAAPLAGLPGGLFAQRSNIGSRDQNEFTVVPEVELRFGYNVTKSITIFAGYNFMYISNVVRPGDQMDRGVDLRQSPISATFDGSTRTRPAPLINSSSFWVQGFTAGLEWRFGAQGCCFGDRAH